MCSVQWSREAVAVSLPAAVPILALLVLVGCSASVAPPTIAAGPIASADVSRSLSAEDLAADAVDRAELLRVLDDAGFGAARELAGADRAAGIHRAAARAIAFADADGAGTYLAWLGDHADEILGTAEVVGTVEPAAADDRIEVFRHEPGDCCPKATVTYFTAWRDDDVVITLELAGPGVEVADVAAAAERVELAPTS
jgi:hypothetical protein